MENWKEVPNTNGFYEVSNLGRLRRGKLPDSHKWLTKKGMVLNCYKRPSGYLFHVLHVNKKRFNRSVHGLVCEAFLGKTPDGMCVNHKNGIKTDNRLENLEYVTFSQNNIHSFRFLGKCLGEKHGRSKLTDKQVLYIRSLPKFQHNGGKLKELSKKLGVSTVTIRNVRIRKIWTHI
jgi:hypothetical protein